MSGPKISVYNLTDVVMANIIEDIRRQEKIAVRRVQLLQTEKEYKDLALITYTQYLVER